MSEKLTPKTKRLSPRKASAKNLLAKTIKESMAWLAKRQNKDGHWLFELEADATIPAEYIMLNHFLGEPNDELESKLAAYLRAAQGVHGGWPLYHDGDFNISASVKAYYALKLTGEDIDAPHMRFARHAILDHGGAAKSNVFTRFALALFGQLPWRAVPVIRIESLLLPKWAPFHIDKVSYWSRTVMVPLMVLAALKPLAQNPRGHGVLELFTIPPSQEKNYITNPTGHWLGDLLILFDRLARFIIPMMPKSLEKKAINKAMQFVHQRLNGLEGLGGIFPAMANSVMAMDALGYSRQHPDYVTARQSIDRLLVIKKDSAYCQPCLSPVWDTGLAALAMLEAGVDPSDPILTKAGDWLASRQILEVKGDWQVNRGHLRPGGWAFQYWNDYYPDVDDTAVVVMALHRINPKKYRKNIERATEWIIGMQSRNGGWGAFDADNEYYFLQHIPFADHGALLDPPTADVTARCLGMLGQLGYAMDHPVVARGLKFLRDDQQEDGSWFGRWGNNYIYGTWSVLNVYNILGKDMNAPHIRKAIEWLKSCQRPDNGWGEDCASYWQHRRDEVKESTPSQTSWALLGLLAAGEVNSDVVQRGVDYLLKAPRNGGKWREEYFNAVGFPRIFYLRYHGYSAYFTLWALARFCNLKDSNLKRSPHGM